MSTDCIISLPDSVRVRWVSEVMGVLAGCERKIHQHDRTTWWYDIKGVKIETTTIPEMVEILIDRPCKDGKIQVRYVHYHFESSYGGRLMMPKSYAFWCALGSRLVQFFGGKMVYNDFNNDLRTPDVKFPCARFNAGESDKMFKQYRNKLGQLQPLTDKEIRAMSKVAAYDFDKEWDLGLTVNQ